MKGRNPKEEFTFLIERHNVTPHWGFLIMAFAQRRFRIEQSNGDTQPFTQPSSLASLRAGMGNTVKPHEPEISVDLIEAYRREIAEVMQLKSELEAIQHAIDETKVEIATLHIGRPAQVGIGQISGEIGAIVQQTEIAANTILNAAERIENKMSDIITHIDDRRYAEQHVSDVMMEVSQLYEACNFQDLTGQRLSRVMDTFGFVEQRIEKMLMIWGGLSAIDHLLQSEAEAKREAELAIGDQALANGPQVTGTGGHVGQLEIDALFD
jgi:chemotaxis protein CheZ